MARNITLKLDEATLRKARHAAVEEDQSLSEWVSNRIKSAVSVRENTEAARKRALNRLKKGFRLSGKPLDREEAHER
jgi:hypothetical protein